MVAEIQFIKQKLKEAGIKSQIHTSMKYLKQSGESHIGAVLRNGETFTRFASSNTYIDAEGNRVRRNKIYKKDTVLKVIIGDSDEENCELILEQFLRLLGKGMESDGNWIDIKIGKADWVETGDSILKSKVAVEIDVTFEGGIYKDTRLKTLPIGEIK